MEAHSCPFCPETISLSCAATCPASLCWLPWRPENCGVTCSCSVLLATAACSADKAESGGRVREVVREGEEAEEAEEEPRSSASSGAPVVSWSASEDESPSDSSV